MGGPFSRDDGSFYGLHILQQAFFAGGRKGRPYGQ